MCIDVSIPFFLAAFKTSYDSRRTAKLQNIEVYIGNSSIGIHINDTTNITEAVKSLHRLNSYSGPPTSGDSVIVRAQSDYVSNFYIYIFAGGDKFAN